MFEKLLLLVVMLKKIGIDQPVSGESPPRSKPRFNDHVENDGKHVPGTAEKMFDEIKKMHDDNQKTAKLQIESTEFLRTELKDLRSVITQMQDQQVQTAKRVEEVNERVTSELSNLRKEMETRWADIQQEIKTTMDGSNISEPSGASIRASSVASIRASRHDQNPHIETENYDIVALGFPAFSLNTDIETVLEEIKNTFDGVVKPSVVKLWYRAETGLLRFAKASDHRAFLKMLKDTPPSDSKINDANLKLSYKISESKEERARTKEIRWWGWALSREEYFGAAAKNRNFVDTDRNRLVVLFGNDPVAGFVDDEHDRLKGPMDRTKHVFKVDADAMKKFISGKGYSFDVQVLIDEFHTAMAK